MPYIVTKFDSLVKTIAKCSKPEHFGNDESLADNMRVLYLNEYLHRLGVKTAIIEHEYIDRNFIDDYCGYYGKCFAEYPKKCERIHFFSYEFDNISLKSCVLPNGDHKLRDKICHSYVGHIVMRPIMGAHFGRVCLATYPDEPGKNRLFPILKQYKSHFMGLELNVKTVAFQEQDNVISACATSALWSAFHAVEGNRPEDVPSPYTITMKARQVMMESEPYNVMDKGLFPSQMASAIADEGFSPILSEFVSKSYFKAIARAYLNVGIPVILGMTLAREDESRPPSDSYSNNCVIGEHAVTLLGYRLSDSIPPAFVSHSLYVRYYKK